jgi:hypothetical protein
VQVNLIYLAKITDRVPIMGQFVPSHVLGASNIRFGDVFDIPRMRKSLGIPILEWHEVKDESSEVYDEIGCWNVWQAVQYRESFPRQSSIPDVVKLGEYTQFEFPHSFKRVHQIYRTPSRRNQSR